MKKAILIITIACLLITANAQANGAAQILIERENRRYEAFSNLGWALGQAAARREQAKRAAAAAEAEATLDQLFYAWPDKSRLGIFEFGKKYSVPLRILQKYMAFAE